MKKVILLIGVAVVALLGVSYTSYAQDYGTVVPGDDDPAIAPPQDQENWPPQSRRARIVEELNLTEEQMNKIETLRLEGQKEMIASLSKLKIAKLELAELMKTQGNDDAVISKSREIAALQNEAMEMRIRHQLSMRAVFTQEQWDKISTFKKMRGQGRHFRGQPGMMRNQREMRRPGMRGGFQGQRPGSAGVRRFQ